MYDASVSIDYAGLPKYDVEIPKYYVGKPMFYVGNPKYYVGKTRNAVGHSKSDAAGAMCPTGILTYRRQTGEKHTAHAPPRPATFRKRPTGAHAGRTDAQTLYSSF